MPDTSQDSAAFHTLNDGTAITIRAIDSSDAPKLVQSHENLSLESTRLRFFTPHPHLSEGEVERFTNVDHHDREAFIAMLDGEILGVGRYDRVPSTDTAEIAFIVADAWQGKGIATHLLAYVRRHAEREGIAMLIADTLGENVRMRHVFEASGPIASRTWDHGVVHLEMPLDTHDTV